MKLKRDENIGILFALPTLIVTFIFSIYPLFKTFIYAFSFTDEKGKIVEYAGLENFYELFTDPAFYSSLIATFKFAIITVTLSIMISLFLAILCNEKIKGIGFFRMVFSSSLGVSISAAASVVLFMFHPSLGIINEIIEICGGTPINWLTDSKYALITVAISTIWMNIGFGFLVLTAGLQNISADVDESCLMDGAGYFTKLFKVTIPLLSPSIFYLVITTTLKAFQSFGIGARKAQLYSNRTCVLSESLAHSGFSFLRKLQRLANFSDSPSTGFNIQTPCLTPRVHLLRNGLRLNSR